MVALVVLSHDGLCLALEFCLVDEKRQEREGISTLDACVSQYSLIHENGSSIELYNWA